MSKPEKLTERQKREIEYHREHAHQHRHRHEHFSWDIIHDSGRRWWNQHWAMFTTLLQMDLAGKRTLVVGCGLGDDALLLAKLGAEVHAFDLSPDVLEIAREVAAREQLQITFTEMAAEQLTYPSDFFDCIVVRDILHHVEVGKALSEISRVAKAGACVVINEIYTHSLPDRIRQSALVERYLYPLMKGFIYGKQKPYITQDERKLDERNLKQILSIFADRPSFRFFDFIVNRLIPDRLGILSKLDYIALNSVGPFAQYLAGRILLVGTISKVVFVRKPKFSTPLTTEVQTAE
ncbi:MAG: class I SAM-dependent methyltransferase, partial [Nitrospirota bacterium]|nr:class I SAM-dependent methyltransferase [Nitrospirota bacterium]